MHTPSEVRSSRSNAYENHVTRKQSHVAIFARIRARALLCLLLVTVMGCGDCVEVTDFVDIVPTDFGQMDEGVEDMSDMGVADADMARRPPSDMDILFDFPPLDQGNTEFLLTGVVPNSGPVSGGTLVRIQGTGLSDDSTVFFGSQSATATLSAQELVVRTPPASGPGIVPVKVQAPNGDIRVLNDAFRYTTDLRVDTITPTRIPTEGGFEVEIRGSGFEAPTAVNFGSKQALRTTVVDASLVRAIAPPNTRGTVDLRVTTVEDSVTVDDAIEYFDAIEIIDISPPSGLAVGGDTVILTVDGLLEEPTVFFGTQQATVTNVNLVNGLVQVTTPAGAAGVVDVFVETTTDATVRPDGFLYRADASPRLGAIRPAVGPSNGGQSVEILGYGLDTAGTTIEFGTTQATIAQASADAATVTTPAGSGFVDVVLRQSGTEIDRLVAAYRYVPAITLSASSPVVGSADGGDTVTLTGVGFTGTQSVVVGGVPMPFEVVSDTEIRVTTTAHSAGTADITVKRDGLEATLPDAFEFSEPLEIWGFTPVRGSMAGGTYVELRGRGFFGTVEVFMDALPAPTVTRIDRNNIVFRTPPGDPGESVVSLVVDTSRVEAPYTYLYFDPASRLGGASGGEVDGSVNVTVFSLGGGPIEDAFVMLSTREETPYQGFTDINGMLTLSGPDVLGAQTITATAAGYSTTTIQTLDSENVTIFLNLLDPQGQPGAGAPPPRGAISGTIKATGKLADPDDENTYDLAIVQTTQRTPTSFNPPPGQGSIVLGEGAYEIVTRIGDMAVVGLCGEYNDVTEEFTPRLMAVERFVFVSDQDQLEIDLECNIPLDETISFKLINTSYAPSGPNNNRVQVFWDFGFEGVVQSPVVGESLSDVVDVPNQPAPAGILSDISFIAIGGSYTFQGGSPFSQTSISGITDISQRVLFPPLLDVAEPVSPLPGGQIENNTLMFQYSGPYFPDFHVVTLRNDLGIPVYAWLLPGDQTNVVVPEFPDFSSLPAEIRPNPLLQQTLFLNITAARVNGGHIYDDFTYGDLEIESWNARSSANWSARLPQQN